jgi:hypothetical protein
VIGTDTLGANEPSEGATSAKFSHHFSGSGRNGKFSKSFDWKIGFLVGSYRTFPPAGPFTSTLVVAELLRMTMGENRYEVIEDCAN